jgi:hypothetical protein
MLWTTNFRSFVLFSLTATLLLGAAATATAEDRRHGRHGGEYHDSYGGPEVVLEAPGLRAREARHLRGAVLVERPELQADIRALEARIHTLSDISLRARPRLRDELCHQISAMKGELARLKKRVRTAERVDVRIEGRRGRKADRGRRDRHHVATTAELHSIKRSVRSSPYSNDQLLTLTAIAKKTHFTSAQARELAGLFVYSNHRLDALVLLYPQVVDPQNFHETYSLLTYSNDRRKLMRRIGAI